MESLGDILARALESREQELRESRNAMRDALLTLRNYFASTPALDMHPDDMALLNKRFVDVLKGE